MTPVRPSLGKRLGRWSLLPLVPLAWPLGFAYGLWGRRRTLWQSRPTVTLSPRLRWVARHMFGTLVFGISVGGLISGVVTVGPWLWQLLPSWPAPQGVATPAIPAIGVTLPGDVLASQTWSMMTTWGARALALCMAIHGCHRLGTGRPGAVGLLAAGAVLPLAAQIIGSVLRSASALP